MKFEEILSGGHPNSLGRTAEVVQTVLRDERRLTALFETLQSEDAVVRMRAGDALEKVCRQRPEWLQSHFAEVRAMAEIDQPSVQWHTAQILSQIRLTPARRRWAVSWLWRTLQRTDDWIVIAEILTALTSFRDGPDVGRRLRAALHKYQHDRRPAVARRATKLLEALS